MATLTQETANTIIQTLQPIRDLTKNWDIDIAACLDDYLQDLELSVETRQQLSTTKFAEAALVLHNSSGVYSRKVDYLHSYAYRVQRDLADKALSTSTTANGSANNKRTNVGIDKEVERFLNYDPNQDFLLLDDVLPAQPEEKVNLKDSNASVSILDASFANSRTSTRRLSASSHRTLSDSNVQRIGSILNVEGLRLSLGKCDVDDDGMCWLPGSQSSSQPLYPRNTSPKGSNENHQPVNDRAADQSADAVERNDFVPMDDGIDEDNDEVGFDMVVNNTPTPETKKVTFAVEAEERKPPLIADEPEDPWKLLDPHVFDTKRLRPLRIGKTIKLPKCMTRLPSEHGRKKDDPIPDYLAHIALDSSIAEQDNDSRSWTTGKRAREELPLRGLAYGNEFAYVAKELARRKAREQKNDANHVIPQLETVAPFNDDMNHFDDGDDDLDDEGGLPDFAPPHDGLLESNTGLASVDDIYGNNDIGFQEAEGNQERQQSFEELCREHIRRFAKGAERYAVQTKLSERVDQWQSKLRPLLDAEERRPVFDIHEYGKAVIQNIQKSVAETSQKRVGFADVTRNCSRYEVCRRFLASLSLVNSGNIRLVEGPDVQFELVSISIERPMENYLAPSVKGTHLKEIV